MDVIATMLITIVQAVGFILQVLVIGSFVVSLLNADYSNPIVRMITQTTEPMYRPIRRFTANIPGPFDWAPLIVIILIVTIQKGLIMMLAKML